MCLILCSSTILPVCSSPSLAYYFVITNKVNLKERQHWWAHYKSMLHKVSWELALHVPRVGWGHIAVLSVALSMAPCSPGWVSCSLSAQRTVAEARLPAAFTQSCLFLQPLHPASLRNIFPAQTSHVMTKAEGHRFSQFV